MPRRVLSEEGQLLEMPSEMQGMFRWPKLYHMQERGLAEWEEEVLEVPSVVLQRM